MTNASLATATVLTAAGVSGSPLDDFNSGTLVANFLFNESAGTGLDQVVSTVNPLAQFGIDTDNEDVVTNGLGQLDVSGKDNTQFGSNYVDLDEISTGVVYSLFEFSWFFDEESFNPSQDEELRFGLIRDDPRSTFVTAETVFRRTDDDEVIVFGNGVGTGASDTSSVQLGISGSLLTVLAADLDNDTLTLSYSTNNGASFTTLTPGSLEPTRGVKSLRLVIDEDFSDDNVLIDRVAVSVVPEPSSLIILGLAGLALLNRRRRD